MSNFAYDIQLGFLAFPLVALLLAMPYALYQYRRFGAISVWKTFVVFTFILYCMCAISLVVFPLPKDPSHIVEIAQTPQLQPFHVLEQIRETTDFDLADRSTWGPTLKAQAVYEAIFNVMLTMPLGAYLCYLFRCRWWQALLIGFATTLMFETSQLTALFGTYDHPYRLFDVDDLILNTTGAMLGFWLMIPLSWALPSMTEVNEQSRERGSSRVSLTRRLIATIVDLTILLAVFAIAWIMLSPTDAQIAKALAVDPSRAGAKTLAFRFIGGLLADPMSALLIALALGAILFAVIPLASKGRTIGKALVGIHIVRTDGSDAPAWSYWVRYLASALFLLVPLALVLLAPEEIEGASSSIILQVVGLIVIVWLLTIVARVIGSFSGRPYVSLSEIVSGTRLAPTNQGAASEAAETSSRNERSAQQQANNPTAHPANSDLRQENDQVARTQLWTNDLRGNHPEDQRTIILGEGASNAPTRQQDALQRHQGNPATEDDHGKQAALDSLLTTNYDEQYPVHPVGSAAPTAPVPHASAGQAPSPAIDASSLADRTQRITDPNVQRKIRRDQRPDAGGTRMFKKH